VGGESLARGNFARHVEEYIRTRDHDAAEQCLDEWAQTLPADKLHGYWSLLRARLLIARSLYGEAVMEVRVLLAANDASPYAPELLMEAAIAHKSLNQPDQTRAILERIVKEYSESQTARQAQEMLKAGR